MGSRKLATINTITGELEETGVMAFVSDRTKFGEFMFLMQEGIAALAKMDLTGDDLRILLFILSKLDYQNRFKMSQTEAATELNMRVQNINRHFRALKERNIIAKISTREYVVSDFYVWKGRLKDASPELKARGAAAWKRAKEKEKQRIAEEQAQFN